MAHKDLKTFNDTAIIVCTSNTSAPEQFSIYPKELLTILIFFDITDARSNMSINEEQAKSICDFANKAYQNKISDLYVCCDSGESRSAAVAAAIIRFYSKGRSYRFRIAKEEKKIWSNPAYHPNTYVYKMVCNAFSMKTSNFGIWKRKRTSNKALKRSINSARK